MMDVNEVYQRCKNQLPGHGPQRTAKEIFRRLADSMDEDEKLDIYGQGALIDGIEKEVAEIFGKEAAVFMPSGIMAQQVALRIWCEQRGNFTVAMHPTVHLEWAEHLAYQHVHRIHRLQFGSPESLRDRLLTVKDFEDLEALPGAVLLELPHRPLGGQLPVWEDLLAAATWAKEGGIPLHLDGARIWSCRPFYQKEYREIAELFDSIYVSFYKDLGGLAGSILMGSADFVKSARMWQRRLGGNLFTLTPYVASARKGLREVLPQIDQWVIRAQQVAQIFSQFPQISIVPDPPHVNFFRIYIQGDAQGLTEKHMELAVETGTFIFYGLSPSPVPGVATTEIHLWENSVTFDLEQLQPFLKRLLA